MSNSIVTAPTEFLQTPKEKYAYRRFGRKSKYPLLFLQHFTGTLDNWDPAVTDPLAADHDVILFENAGVGRSTGKVPTTMAGMAEHVITFLDTLAIKTCNVLGFSLGGVIAQQMALDYSKVFRKMILVGTAPRGGEDIMHLDKPILAKPIQDPKLKGYEVLQKIFFAPTETSQAAGKEFIGRLIQRQQDREPISGPEIAQAQMAAFRRVGEICRRAIRRLEANSAANARRQRNSRRDDPCLELLLAKRKSAERCSSHLPGCGSWLLVPMARLVHASGCGFPCFGFAIRTVLKLNPTGGIRYENRE